MMNTVAMISFVMAKPQKKAEKNECHDEWPGEDVVAYS